MSAQSGSKKTPKVNNLTNGTLATGDDTAPKRMQDISKLTNVTLVTGDDKVLYAYNVCDKSYDKKSSYHSHMRTKHRATKESEVEKGTKTTQKKKGSGILPVDRE